MTRRSGATLVEVLVAIFVMGIGMMALLTLFPIGVLTMRQAIQDDRTGHAATSALAVAKMKISPSRFDAFFTQPNAALQPAVSDGPSYAIMLDTVGKRNYLAPYADWVGGQTDGVRRLTFPNPTVPNDINNNPLHWQISPDDIVFDQKGLPQELAQGTGIFERNSAYSWSYLLRRPLHGKANIIDTTIIVYNDRPLQLNNNLQAGETVYDAAFNPNARTITVTWGGPGQPLSFPPVNVGGWILDTTPVLVTAAPAKFGPSHAKFYRVVSINQTSGNTADLEVEGAIHGFPLPAPSPANTFTGKITVIEGIADVFEKGPILWQNP